MRVKCLAQEHNAAPRPGLEPGPFDPESSALTIRPPRLPCKVHARCKLKGQNFLTSEKELNLTRVYNTNGK